MAELIAPGAEPAQVSPAEGTFRLQEMYDLIGCSYVQAVALSDGRTMWMDEEGKYATPPLATNEHATRLLHEAGGVPWDSVVGKVLITEDEEVD